jgi:hypothetical protein
MTSTISTNGPIIGRLSKYLMMTYLIQSKIGRVSTVVMPENEEKFCKREKASIIYIKIVLYFKQMLSSFNDHAVYTDS